MLSHICGYKPGKLNSNWLSCRLLVRLRMKWFRYKWFLLLSVGKEFCEWDVVASPCLGIKSAMFSCKVLWDLLPLSSQPRCLNVPSVPLHVLLHPPGLLFFPYSSNLVNSYGVFTSSERAPGTACSGQTPHCPVFYCITSHYLFSQMFRSLGTETVATLFPGIISVANTLHSAWHIWVGLLCCRKEQKNECERQVSEQWGRKQGHRS